MKNKSLLRSYASPILLLVALFFGGSIGLLFTSFASAAITWPTATPV